MDILVPLPPCIEGRVLARVRRFSILFEHAGRELWAHTNNSGSMTGILHTGQKGLFSLSSNPRRKLPHTLERLRLPDSAGGDWVGVNTMLPNKLLAAAFERRLLDFCRGYDHIKAEAKRGRSRFDAVCASPDRPPLWIECKSVTLMEDGRAAFPDAVSERAQKHMKHMMEIVASGERAALFLLIQRPHARSFGPAAHIDPEFARLFAEAVHAGVEVYAREAAQEPEGAFLGAEIPLEL